MSSRGKCVLRKRKEMLHEKLNQIGDESRNIIETIQDLQIRAASIVSDLELETDERGFLLKYPVASRKLEEWQIQISRISYDLDVLVCEENRREPEESNTTSTTSQGRQKGENVSSAGDVTLWTIPCPLQENDILDMRFVYGDSPHGFWLRFYSTEELKKIRTSIQKLFEANKLQPLKSSEVLGDVCICNGRDYFRGRVINRCADSSTSYMVLNVDIGSILKVEKGKLYHLTEELAKFPVQAINCCLEGGLGDRALWDACAAKLFHKVMEDSSLVVTICSVPTETCSKFVVKVDVHNEMRIESKIDLNSWITYSVLPTLVQKRTSKSADTLKLLFDCLRFKTELESNASLKENSMTAECISETQAVEGKENKDSRNLYAEDNANGISNSIKEKSYMQGPLSRDNSSFVSLNSMPMHPIFSHKEKFNMQHQPLSTVQQHSSLVSLNSKPVKSMPPHKEKSNLEEPPSNTAQQPTSLLCLHSLPVHPVPPSKEKANVQQQPPNAQRNSSEFLSFKSPPLHRMPPLSQCVPHFLPYQNPPMLVQMGPSSSFTQPMYPYAPQIPPPSLLEINPFHSARPSVALQQQNQPQSFQLQINSLTQNRLTKCTSGKLPAVSYPKVLQSSAEDTQKGRQQRTCISLENKQKEAMLITNPLHGTCHQMETASMIKQTPSAEAKTFGEDFSVSEQENSPPKVNSKSRDGMDKVSLKRLNLKFEMGGRYQAFVVHINDPDDFYVHIACKDTAFIETLDQEITENYNTCSIKFRNKEQAKMMLYESWCAVFYKDEDLWHRGKVINWKDDNDMAVEVQYVDYGEEREVDLSMIKPLKEEYTKLPICATRCRLANIHPPQLQENGKVNVWPSETVELFKVLAVRDKLHSIVVTDTSSDPISVLLVTEDKAVINKALLDYEYAIAFKPIEFDASLPIQLIAEYEESDKDGKLDGNALDRLTEDCQAEVRLRDSGKTCENYQEVDDKENSMQNWNPMAEEFHSAGNTEYHDDENACYAVSGYIPKDEQRICEFYAKNGCCFKGVTCTKEHSMPNPDGWTTDRETVLQNPFSNLVLPPVGTLVTVEVTAIYTLNMFYAHILWEGRIKEEEEETLLTLNECINNRDNVCKMKKPHIIPALGQLVLARFMAGTNRNFYRARVIDTNIEENNVQVVYIDYGNTEWVSKEDIREMEPKYLHLPFQALECYISNVSPKTVSEEALLDLSNMILGRELVGTLKSTNILGHAEIELWVGDQKISDILIEKGYADYRESPLFLSEGASIIPG